eukprot:scaffold482_cov247-Pinguiococcus_pyrenoidosus.AAC.2
MHYVRRGAVVAAKDRPYLLRDALLRLCRPRTVEIRSATLHPRGLVLSAGLVGFWPTGTLRWRSCFLLEVLMLPQVHFKGRLCFRPSAA